MLITRDMLNEAIMEKKSLFHDGDEIDDDVFYDLFIGHPAKRIHRQTKKEYYARYNKEELSAPCSELKSDPKTKTYDKIKCYLTCSICGKKMSFYIKKRQITNRTFNYKVAMDSLNLNYKKEEGQLNLYYKHVISLYYKDIDNLLICNTCISSVKKQINNEARAFLSSPDKFEWIKENYWSGDWKNRLVLLVGYKEFKSGNVITEIKTIDGEKYTNEDFTEEQQRELEVEKIRLAKKEEARKHREELRRIQKERLVAEEEERIRVKRANELFLAKHQKNTPTQRYINTFCNENSEIDITDKGLVNEALYPDLNEVCLEDVQKHNCKMYKNYLNTPLWKIISSKIKWNAYSKCEKCGSTKYLQVHHKSYDFKGVEFLAMEDLECLCSECHAKEHQNLK